MSIFRRRVRENDCLTVETAGRAPEQSGGIEQVIGLAAGDVRGLGKFQDSLAETVFEKEATLLLPGGRAFILGQGSAVVGQGETDFGMCFSQPADAMGVFAEHAIDFADFGENVPALPRQFAAVVLQSNLASFRVSFCSQHWPNRGGKDAPVSMGSKECSRGQVASPRTVVRQPDRDVDQDKFGPGMKVE